MVWKDVEHDGGRNLSWRTSPTGTPGQHTRLVHVTVMYNARDPHWLVKCLGRLLSLLLIKSIAILAPS